MSRIKHSLLILFVCLVALAAVGSGSGSGSGSGKGRKKGGTCPPTKLKRQWGGKPARGINYQVRPVRFVIIHHTVTAECSGFVECAEILQGMQAYHQTELDYYDIGYK